MQRTALPGGPDAVMDFSGGALLLTPMATRR
jgi:hypothetical protein